MRTSECFKIMRDYYEITYPSSAFNRYLCIVADCCLPNNQASQIKQIFAKLLGSTGSTLEWWLRTHHPDIYTSNDGFRDPYYQSMLYNTRLAWLDHLIAHYESIGD